MKKSLVIVLAALGAFGLVAVASARIRSKDGPTNGGLISANAAAAFRAFCREHCRR